MNPQPMEVASSHHTSLVKKSITYFFLLLMCVSVNSKADIAQGYAWLAAQQQSDGRVESRPSLAHPLQSTADTVLAFDQDSDAGGLNRAQALDFIASNAELSTEFVARALLLGIETDTNGGSLVEKLISHQNPGGGFGSFESFDSNVLDTALALSALSSVKANYPQPTGFAVSYLIDQQSADGAFSLYLSETASPPLTAIVSIALQNYIFDYSSVSQIVTSANQYLLVNQSADLTTEGNWQAALSLLAVVPTVRDSSRYASLVNGLVDAQQTNGSWGEDDFTTALAIRALQLAENITFPEEPTTGVFSGQVLDDSTGNALVNVVVTLAQNTDLTAVTDEQGRFSIIDVAPAEYTINYEAQGYLGASQAASTVVGQVTNLGEVRLPRVPNTAIITGTVTDAISMGALPSASLLFTVSNTTVAVPLDANGFYNVALTPDSYSFVVSALGYQSIAGSATVAAGNNLSFSPALYPEDVTPVETVVTITGSVVDAAGNNPIANAIVQALDSDAVTVSVNTDSSGVFTFDDLAEGEITLIVTAEGYASRQLTLLAPAGSQSDTGSISLTSTEEPVTSSIFGAITSSETGEPILGATVLLEETSNSVTSLSSGLYTLSDIEPLNFTLFISAPGYWSQRTVFSFDEIGSNRFDVALTPSDLGGFAIDQLTSDELSYPAYSPVSIAANLTNPSDQAVSARLYLEIFNVDNTLITGLAIGDAVGGNTPGEAISVLPNTSASITAQWYTGIVPPGDYYLKLSAYDQFTFQLLSENVSYFEVVETANINTANLAINTRFSNVGVEENLMLTLNTVNRSNIPVDFTLAYQWLDPADNILRTGSAELRLLPSEASKPFALDDYLFTFDLGGVYPFIGTITSDQVNPSVQGVVINVAPSVRVDVTQRIMPNPLVPDGDKTVNIGITVKGVEQ